VPRVHGQRDKRHARHHLIDLHDLSDLHFSGDDACVLKVRYLSVFPCLALRLTGVHLFFEITVCQTQP
jgi:hypothetical protein